MRYLAMTVAGGALLLAALQVVGGGDEVRASTEFDLPDGDGIGSEVRDTQKAIAPDHFGTEMLGKAFTEGFKEIPGESLFPGAKKPKTRKVRSLEVFNLLVEDTTTLAMNFGGWGLEAHAGGSVKRRYASQRWYLLKNVKILDDSDDPVGVPDNAYYYLHRIYYGHMLERVIHGKKRKFDAGVRADFLVYKGGIKTFAKKHKLQEHIVMRGIKPSKAKKLFTDPSKVADYFELAKKNPVPIFVVYRQVAGRTPPPTKKIKFKESYVAEGKYRFTVERAEIFKKNGGADWDPIGDSRPDPYVELWVGKKIKGGKLSGATKNMFFKTKTKEDKLQPSWLQHGVVNLYGDETIRIEIWDDDATGRDSIGKCNLPRLKNDKGEFELQCGKANLFRIHYEKQ
ncbi:MAG: hypothetical protein JRF63_06055 [Deltaproteobacteria bacterium]|nr:hypothetical protein [Deltaproteobacteria bacterium]